MENPDWMELALGRAQTTQLLKMNPYTQKYGLTLSEEDAQELMERRKQTLAETKRVEFGQGILPKMIYEFCDSAYISQSDYVETLTRLQEIFYHYKNEMMDEVSDDELLYFMREQFETTCKGDLDYLSGTCLAVFARAVRDGYRGYQRSDGRGIYEQMDEVSRWDRELYLKKLKELFWG